MTTVPWHVMEPLLQRRLPRDVVDVLPWQRMMTLMTRKDLMRTSSQSQTELPADLTTPCPANSTAYKPQPSYMLMHPLHPRWWHVRTWWELLHRARLSCRPTWQLHALYTVHSTDHNPHTRSYTLFIPADGPECYPCVFTCCNTLLFLHLPLPYCYVFLWVPALHATLKTIRSLSLYSSVHLYCLCHWLIDWCLDR